MYKTVVCENCLADIEYKDEDLIIDGETDRKYISCPACGEGVLILEEDDNDLYERY